MRKASFYFAAISLFLLAWVGLASIYGGGGAQAAATPPPGGLIWAHRFGSSGGDNGHRIATDANGDVLVTGYFSGTVDFGGGPLTSPGADDIFIAKFSGVDGSHLWSKGFAGTDQAPGSDAGVAVAVDGSGNVLITGYFRGAVDFGGGPLISAGSWDFFVAKFAAADGAHLWSQRFGDTDDDVGYTVVADGSGNVLLAGNFSGTVNFGGGPVTSVGSADLFVAKFSGVDGTHLWSQRFGDTGYDAGNGVAVDESENVLLAGSFQGSVDFGGDVLTSAGASDIFVAKFAGADGAHIWSQRFGGTNSDSANGIAADSSGNVLVTGEFMGPLDFGGDVLTSAGSYDIFVAKFSGADGSHLWSQRFGGASDDGGRPVAVDGSGDVLLAGYFCGTVDFGGGPLTSMNCGDIFVAKFSGMDSSHLWSQRFGGASHDAGNGVAVDQSGNVLVTGSFQGSADFGGDVLTSAGAYDMFVMKLASGIPNQPPVANAGADQTAIVGESLPFNGAASYDPDGTITNFHWDFGGDGTANGAIVNHLFNTAGQFTVTLTVTDDDGETGSDTAVITVLSASQAIESLTQIVQGFNLQQGITNALDSKLQNIQDAMNASNAGWRQDTINKLQAFISSVEAQRGKQLTAAQADTLVALARRILAVI